MSGVWEGMKGSIPIMEKNVAFFLLLLNICWPGLGTLIWSYKAINSSAFKLQLLCAILQMIFWGFIIGWLWSVYWGSLAFERGVDSDAEKQKLLQGNLPPVMDSLKNII